MRKGHRDPDALRYIRTQRYSDPLTNQFIRSAALLVAAACPPGARFAGVDPLTGELRFFEEKQAAGFPVWPL